MNKEEIAKEIQDRLKYFWGDIDGNIYDNLPNSLEGDILKLVVKYFE